MSSAAVQQSTTPQHYQQREHYSADPSASILSTSPSSRRSGRHGNGGDGSYGASNPSSTMTPSRGQHQSPSEGMSASTYDQYYPDSAGSRGQPTALPIRTSSQQPTSPSYDSRAYNTKPGYDGSGGYSSQDDRERRQSHRSPQPSPAAPQSSSRSQRSRQTPVSSRSQTAVGQPPVDTSLPREHSAIINRIIVDDPQSDISREKARIADARPNAGGAIGSHPTPEPDRSSAPRSRQEHLKSASKKEVKFGDYILGQTLGEGEFGKVKMGWKKEGGVQVAIKLIRKESLAGNSTRLPKIYREIAILRELQHPNIVRLHEFVETERHMGIILEYASGGELFDYILNHRYLKDPAARRLFAQLVSGVGYLHKKGIVHRDLKLENLLLDRHKNIIITDFGFANTFDPKDDLSEEQEHRITDKDYVKRSGLDIQNKEGFRKGDLMQTSCGSPCYAAPELVVSDGLYTGRKVDVWSCGVILYAMLAGYLPFDDDPANPEGDNINLLYKYIVSTPLTFPEYVTPHARDLLRRILVPDPRRRADLFEVARHSWLSDYSHVVGFIGSSAKSDRDIAKSAVSKDEEPVLARSASVREPSSRSPAAMAAPAGLKQQPMDAAEERKTPRDAKRRTVQVEYVAPNGATTRGEASPPLQAPAMSISGGGRTRARAEGQGPVEIIPSSQRQHVPRKEVGSSSSSMPPPSRPNRDQPRGTADNVAFGGQPMNSVSRPNTRGTLASRGNSYSQPAVATPTTENAQGHFSRPKSGSGYMAGGSANPSSPLQGPDSSRPGSSGYLPQMQPTQQLPPPNQRGHKRSSTLGSLTDRVLGRSNSRRNSQQAGETNTPPTEKRDRRHPPLSMKTPLPMNNEDAAPRPSSDSRRSSFQFLRKTSEQGSSDRRNSRRFSFLPNSFSMGSFSGKQNQPYDSVQSANINASRESRNGRPGSKGMAFGRGTSRSPSQSTNSTIPQHFDEPQRRPQDKALPAYPPTQGQQSSQQYANPPQQSRKQYRDDGYGSNALDSPSNPAPMRSPRPQQDPPERFYTPDQELSATPDPNNYRRGGGRSDAGYGGSDVGGGREGSQIRPNQRRFGEQYEKGNEGSSSGARRVMDFFRRRGRERAAA